MRAARSGTSVAALFVLGAVVGGRIAVAQGQDPGAPYRPGASSSASGSASMEAPPPLPEVSGHKLWVPRIDVEPIPQEPSPMPGKGEWATAPIAKEARVTEPNCKVLRIREWYQIRCSQLSIQLVAGERKDVDLNKRFSTKDASFPDEVFATFPARRGDRRFFQIYRWSKWAPGEPDAHASEHWLEGEALPQITVQGLRWGI